MRRAVGFEDTVGKLDKDDKMELLGNIIDTLDNDTRYAIVLRLEELLNAANYDYMVFDRKETT
jgi:hypothetical protein